MFGSLSFTYVTVLMFISVVKQDVPLVRKLVDGAEVNSSALSRSEWTV
jgi:hypothetical protein